MGSHVHMHARARGNVTKFPSSFIPQVSLCEPRVKFVKGWLTGGTDPADGSVECGDGTAYPIEVTPNQLQKIFYRVRDSEWTGGFFKQDDSFSSFELTTSSVTPTAQLVQSEASGNDTDKSIRGYVAIETFDVGTSPEPDGPLEKYPNTFGTAYDKDDNHSSLTDKVIRARDCIDEKGIWAAQNIYGALRNADVGIYFSSIQLRRKP